MGEVIAWLGGVNWWMPLLGICLPVTILLLLILKGGGDPWAGGGPKPPCC
jgi:hypothetical protein